MESFLGLDPVEWQAIGTIALVAVTAIYVVLTNRLAGAAKRSATAAEAAALHAQSAAESTRRIAELTESAELARTLPLLTAGLHKMGEKKGVPNHKVTVRNAGPGEAINVQVQLFRHGQLPGERSPIAGSLPPGSEALGEATCPNEPGRVEVQIRYQDRAGRRLMAVYRGHAGDVWGYGQLHQTHGGSADQLEWIIGPV